MALLWPLVTVIMNLASVAAMGLGADRILSGHLQVGQLTAFLSYLTMILMSVMMASMMLFMAPRAEVSAGRILEVLDTESTVVPPARPVTDLPHGGRVEFDHATFSYPGAEAPVLRDVSLVAEPGMTTAVIGATGSGKSTLVNLIPRLFDATAGTVRVDDVDVRDLDPDLLWSRIGLVPQTAFLFSGTIASNLRLGRAAASDEELWEALRIADAEEFVARLPAGLEAEVAQGGGNFSGGQRQRLAIARAIVKRPEVYVFDDSFSALDVATDARVRASLRAVTHRATVLVVAQRVSTIMGADRIVVMAEGRVIGTGTHDELLADCPTYAEIVDSQLAGAR
jgi:ATP-binding cassette subfamily B protein